MSKLKLDQYFTSPDIAEYCFKKTLEIIGEENISEFIESSAGEGIFLNQIEKYTPHIPYKAYDIDVRDERVIEQDFLKLEMEYKSNRLTGFNPPFGKNTLSVQFYKKSLQLGDYICFILPISQFNNNYLMYEFDMVYSENLGIMKYSNKDVNCCFNIYKRNKSGLNKKPNYKLKDIEIYEYRRNEKAVPNIDYDFRMCSYGSIGKEVEFDGKYVKEICIKINKYKEEVLGVLRNVEWRDVVPFTTTPSLPQWQVYKYLKEMIPELE